MKRSASRGSDWIAGWLRRPIAVLSWAGALLMAGMWAALNVPVEWVPQLELPEIRVSAYWGGASPRQMERYVTAPIERVLQTVPGTADIESFSEESSANISLSVAEDVDLGVYTAQVNERLMLLRDVLPDRVYPQLTKQVPEALRDEQGFITLQLVGPRTPDELRSMAEEHLAPQFQSLDGMGEVAVEGGTERELLIKLDPNRLTAHNIEPDDVRLRLLEAMQDDVYGSLRTQGRSMLLLSPAEGSRRALGRLVVSVPRAGLPPVHLDDIATISLGPAPRRSISRIDGNPVVTLRLERARGSHMIALADAVYARIDGLRSELPPGIRILVADDRTEDVREQLRDLAWRGGLGLMLVILVLLFMLKSVRATLIVLFSVAVALALALALLDPLGLTLNLITFAGLVLVFGLLVDNSVVMVEQLVLQRSMHAQSGLKGLQREVAIARSSLRAVWLPLLGGTLSTIAVMLPLVYLSGELRALFLPFGALVSLALLISLATAALIVPVAGRFLPPGTEPVRRRWLRRAVATPYRWAARFPKLTLLGLFLLLGIPLWLLPREWTEPNNTEWSQPVARLAKLYNATLGTDVVKDVRDVVEPAFGGIMRPFLRNVTFGPGWNYNLRPTVRVSLRFPPGNPIERADSLIHRYEQIALASASVGRTIVRATERSASMQVQFVDGSLMTSEPYMVRERMIRQAILQGGIAISIYGLLPQGHSSGWSGGSSGGESVMATGPNYEDLEELSERFAEHARKRSRRVMGVNTNAGRYGYGYGQTRQVLQFRWDADAQARTGVTARWLSGRMRPVFTTTRPLRYADIEGQSEVPVRLIIDGAESIDVDRVVDRPLAVNDSLFVRLAGLSDYSMVETPAGIERKNQQYLRYISIDFRGPFAMSRKFADSAVETFAVPAGYAFQRRQYSFFTEEVAKSFGWIMLATVIMVFLITAAIFESWRLPLVVMLSLPLAAIGVSAGFLWTGANFAQGAFIGTVLLVGIAVNDSILLADRYRQLNRLRPATSSGTLARLAVRERMRPMWTTTLTTVTAMLPLLVFPDGGDFWLGLAVTVVGGLLAATLLAPVASVSMLSLYRT